VEKVYTMMQGQKNIRLTAWSVQSRNSLHILSRI